MVMTDLDSGHEGTPRGTSVTSEPGWDRPTRKAGADQGRNSVQHRGGVQDRGGSRGYGKVGKERSDRERHAVEKAGYGRARQQMLGCADECRIKAEVNGRWAPGITWRIRPGRSRTGPGPPARRRW